MVHTFSEAHSRASEKSIELEIAKELAESGANVVMAGTKPICSSWFNQEMSERMDRNSPARYRDHGAQSCLP